MSALRLVVFDCDGTLVDSQKLIVTAMTRAFAGHGLEAPAAEAVRRIVGLSLVDAMARLIPEAEPDFHGAVAEDYKAQFAVLRHDAALQEPLFDGARGVLEALRAAGYLLGVATGKTRRGLDHVLALHELEDYFVTLQTADGHPSKPHPAMLEAAMDAVGAGPAETILLGDTSYDMMMATAAGAGALGVGWGYHPADELLAAGARHVAGHFDEVAGLIDQMLRGEPWPSETI